VKIMGTEPVIETVELSKVYPNGHVALDNVSLKVRRGDIVGYLGPNGAGKTTTIKILTSLLKPTSGNAYLDGMDISTEPTRALAKVGCLIEVPGTYGYLTPHELLTYFGKVYRMSQAHREARIKEVLELVRLSRWEHSRIGNFSTGMERRLGLAKALLHEPHILVMDEPVIGLDPKGIREVRELIRRLNEEGVTIFLSSHLLQEVSDTCKSVIFIDDGKVMLTETVDNILHQCDRKVIDVEFLDPLSGNQLAAIEDMNLISELEINNGGGHIHVGYDGTRSSGQRILAQLHEMKLPVVSFTPEKISLERFYNSIVGDEAGVA